MKSKLIYWLTYAGMWLLALLPFRALYILSDGLYLLMRHVVHYRRGVVRKNPVSYTHLTLPTNREV